MIYSRQKGELMVSENRSEAESHAFIGKWCISIHSSFRYSQGTQSFARKPRNVGGKGTAVCLLGMAWGATCNAHGPWDPEPQCLFIIKQAILENSDTFAFAKHELASQHQQFFLSSVIQGERLPKSKQKG